MRNDQQIGPQRFRVVAHELQLAARLEVAGQERRAEIGFDADDAGEIVRLEPRDSRSAAGPGCSTSKRTPSHSQRCPASQR